MKKCDICAPKGFFPRPCDLKKCDLRAPKVASKALDRPNTATCFQIEWSSKSFRVEGSAANLSDGPHGAVGLLLPKRTSKPIDVAVAVHPERAGAVLHGVPVWEDQDLWSSELCGHATHDGFHGRCEQKIDALLDASDDWSHRLDMFRMKF